MYISPITKIYSSFEDAKEHHDKYGYLGLFEDKEPLSIVDLAQGDRNLIMGEPGIGKTELLKKIQEHLNYTGVKTEFISLRLENAIERIESFITEESESPKALCLDALDEVKSNLFLDILKKIEYVSARYPKISIYLSARWVFISKYANSFPDYRFIVISPFTTTQVKKYLVDAGHSVSDVESLLFHVMQFSHGKLVIQIPRYLFYLHDFLKTHPIAKVQNLSRNELFEHFIYSKLDVEDKNLNSDKKSIIKRILEKLALTMEIYQTNTISKDELLTFFDDLKSDLKFVVLSQVNLDVFIEKSLLQWSKEDVDKIEFENAEFQEYLAAKEITRFPEPNHAAFSFASDSNTNEIYPTWFNTFTFLVDMNPSLLEQLLEFSGIRKEEFRIVDEGFFTFLSRINPIILSSEFRKKVFLDVLDYHQRMLQWLPGELAFALPGFSPVNIEMELKLRVQKAELEVESKRYVPLANLVYTVGYLLKAKVPLDKQYWRRTLISYTNLNEAEVLQRHALFALEYLQDPTVIDEIPNLLQTDDQLVSQEFLSACVTIAPDNEKSLGYFIEAVKQNNFYGRYGLFAIKEKNSIRRFLKQYNNDEKLREEFLDDSSIFDDQDDKLVEHIKAVLDNEIAELCKDAIVKSVDYHLYRGRQSSFIIGLIHILRERQQDFISEIMDRVEAGSENNAGLYYMQDFFVETLQPEDIPVYMDKMIATDNINAAMSTMMKIKASQREFWEDLYEAGRIKLPEQYAEWEAAQKQPPETGATSEDQIFLQEFRTHLEPSPGLYDLTIFEYYNRNAQKLELILNDEDKTRFDTLLTKFVLPHNSAKLGLTIEEENEDGSIKRYSSSQISHIYGEALLAAKRRGVDLSPFRSQILCYIPFAYNEKLQKIFEIFPDITTEELAPVIEIYREKKTDLWRHRPENFIEMAQQYHLVEVVPILKEFVKNQCFEIYNRTKAIIVSDSLDQNPDFLREIFIAYKESENEKELASIANGLLITSYADPSAVAWRFDQIKSRAVEYQEPKSGVVHNVGELADELRHSKPFAKPLTILKRPGFEKEYLEILDSAIEIWGRGKEFHTYSQYMWDIVYAYFENLKEEKSYAPLLLLEKKLSALGGHEGANWLGLSMVRLRRSYLMVLGKPNNISDAVRKYNEERIWSDKNIRNSSDLFRHIQDAIETDLKRWVEDEGAYTIIVSKKQYKGNSEYEKLVQMTLKSELSNILRGRGFKVDIAREEQLLNSKRTDFLVRYGFVGPIVFEIKLASSSDVKAVKTEETKSYISMGTYMRGYGASHGVFLIMDDTNAKSVVRAKENFSKIPNVWVASLNCCIENKSTKKLLKKK